MSESDGRFQKTVLMMAGAALLWGGGRWFFHDPSLVECGPFPMPVQVQLAAGKELSAPSGYKIEATDSYTAEAMVVSAKRYSSGREADLSPVDLALAWGPLTTQQALEAIRYSQRGRWYHYKWSDTASLPVSPAEIIHNSANTHVIVPPDREDLSDFTRLVGRGDAVRLKGYLVRVTAPDGWRWNSSRSRSDSGAHSCEVFYVTDARILASSP